MRAAFAGMIFPPNLIKIDTAAVRNLCRLDVKSLRLRERRRVRIFWADYPRRNGVAVAPTFFGEGEKRLANVFDIAGDAVVERNAGGRELFIEVKRAVTVLIEALRHHHTEDIGVTIH